MYKDMQNEPVNMSEERIVQLHKKLKVGLSIVIPLSSPTFTKWAKITFLLLSFKVPSIAISAFGQREPGIATDGYKEKISGSQLCLGMFQQNSKCHKMFA